MGALDAFIDISQLGARTTIAGTDIIHIRSAAGVDSKMTVTNLFGNIPVNITQSAGVTSLKATTINGNILIGDGTNDAVISFRDPDGGASPTISYSTSTFTNPSIIFNTQFGDDIIFRDGGTSRNFSIYGAGRVGVGSATDDGVTTLLVAGNGKFTTYLAVGSGTYDGISTQHIMGTDSVPTLTVSQSNASTLNSARSALQLRNANATVNNISKIAFVDNVGEIASCGLYGRFTDRVSNYGSVTIFSRGATGLNDVATFESEIISLLKPTTVSTYLLIGSATYDGISKLQVLGITKTSYLLVGGAIYDINFVVNITGLVKVTGSITTSGGITTPTVNTGYGSNTVLPEETFVEGGTVVADTTLPSIALRKTSVIEYINGISGTIQFFLPAGGTYAYTYSRMNSTGSQVIVDLSASSAGGAGVGTIYEFGAKIIIRYKKLT